MKKRILVLLAVLLSCAAFCGCEALKEKEPEVSGKTVGQSTYRGFEDISTEYSDEDVIAEGGMVCKQTVVTGGKNNWNTFLHAVEAGEEAEIRIKQKITEDNYFYKDILYNGKTFRMIISVDPENYDFTYPHLLVLEGRRTEESKRSILAVLTDDPDLPFEIVIENEARDVKENLNYQLIYRE